MKKYTRKEKELLYERILNFKIGHYYLFMGLGLGITGAIIGNYIYDTYKDMHLRHFIFIAAIIALILFYNEIKKVMEEMNIFLEELKTKKKKK